MVTVGNAPQLADADEFRSAVGDSGSRRYDDTGDTGFGFSYTNSLRDFNIDDQPPCGGATLDHHAAGQPDSHSRAVGDILRSSLGHRSAQLSVAEEWDGHQRGDLGELHNASHDHGG